MCVIQMKHALLIAALMMSGFPGQWRTAAGRENLALRKHSWSTAAGYYGGDSATAVDGDEVDGYYSIKTSHPFWAVDLGSVYQINRVVIYGAERGMTKFVVGVHQGQYDDHGDIESPYNFQVCYKHSGNNPGRLELHIPTNCKGMVVVVQSLLENTRIKVNEVEVYGYVEPKQYLNDRKENLALRKHSWSTPPKYIDGDSATAVDGDEVDGYCSIKASYPFWAVYLGNEYQIDSVVIYGAEKGMTKFLIGVRQGDYGGVERPYHYYVCYQYSGMNPGKLEIQITRNCRGTILVIQSLLQEVRIRVNETQVYGKMMPMQKLGNSDPPKKQAWASSHFNDVNNVENLLSSHINWNKCPQTKNESSPWMVIDMGSIERFGTFRLRGWNGCCSNSLDGVVVGVTDASPEIVPPVPGNYTVCNSVKDDVPPGEYTEHSCTPVQGRYVVIQLPCCSCSLHLCSIGILNRYT